MSLTWLTQICGNHYYWSVTIAQICAKALIGPSQKSKSEEKNIWLIRALQENWAIVTDQSELFPEIWVNPVSDSRRRVRLSLHMRPTVLAQIWHLLGCSKRVY